ncbi:MAG: nitroreductase family protein [Oscillospiraceae bacterium]|jgi:nitroreductase|nr:nitroreductase family protein [Oscillospiraceae bacterium]
MNEVLKTIAERYSCRRFTDEPVSGEALNLLAHAAIAAPSAVNAQPWRIVVVKNRALISEWETEAAENLRAADPAAHERIMSRGGDLFYNAPALIALPIAPGAELDCGIAAENIALAAASLGLGSLICGLAKFAFAGDKAEEFKARLKFPEGFELGIAVLVGRPAGDGAPHAPDESKIIVIE